eukprot:190899_1
MLTLAVIYCLAGIGFGDILRTHPVDSSYDTFKSWMNEYDIRYSNSNEELDRYTIWKDNIATINDHNSGDHKWSQGVNRFTALTFSEFSDSHLMAPQDCSATAHNENKKQPILNPLHPSVRAQPPEHKDWRDAKIISEVKNQGSCGSCWSFSTTGCLESHFAQYTGQLVSFAEQELVDCADDFNNLGCNGGLPSQAFEYIMFNGGIDTEFNYHYVSGTTKTANANCSFSNKVNNYAGQIYGVYNVTQYNETDIEVKVGTIGPVSICYDVVSGFSSYTGGIYSSTTCGNTSDSVNHAVLAVGYGVEHSADGMTPFWIVKNSWGWSWGVDGYFLIERGQNMCGLSSCASFPIVDPNMML